MNAAVTPSPTRPSVRPVRSVRQGTPASHSRWSLWWPSRGTTTHHPAATRSRVSIGKAQRFIKYAQCTSTWRHIAVILLSPLPGLLVSFVPLVIPLQDPCLGMAHNPGFFAHFFITCCIPIFGSMMQARAVAGIPHSELSTVEIALIAVIGVAVLDGITWLFGHLWRYPVPFTWLVGSGPYIFSIAFGNIIVLRSRILQPSRLRDGLIQYIPSLFTQVSQVIVYPAYSALFISTGSVTQIALIAFFPFIKYALKRSVFAVSKQFSDHAKEVSICSVEICASMYQSLIMQRNPSHFATALLIAIDCLQGVVDVKLFMDQDTPSSSSSSCVPQCEILAQATRILSAQDKSTTLLLDSDLDKYATGAPSKLALSRQLLHALMGRHDPGAAVVVPHGGPVLCNVIKQQHHNSDRLVVTKALEILQSAESILLVEYLETMIPIVSGIYLFVASQLESSMYNPMVRPFYKNPTYLLAAMGNTALYTSLQAMTFAGTCVALRHRYKLPALPLISFVLEHHAWSLQGKIIAWLPVLFAFTIVHYGVDFTFKFDCHVPPPQT